MQQTGKALEKSFQKLKNKLTGEKYHHNLLGESLEDMLRIATAKTLEAPDATTNQQIVETINSEVAAGRDAKEVVSLLKARLRMDNPQKQFLAVKLVEQVLSDCTPVLGSHQQDLLQEAARVMHKPAKPETDAGKRARQAAKELLRKYGQEGTTAFRAVHNEGRAMPRGPAPPGGVPPGSMQPVYGTYGTYVPAPAYGMHQPAYGAFGAPVGMYAPPPGHPPHPPPHGSGVNIETQSLMDEVRLLIDKARSNTELLSDMLVSSSGTPDDFETELIKDLATEVRELREVFNAYLEQISASEDPQMELLLVQALEAVDMLDGAIALQKDVALNQQEFAAVSAATSSNAGSGAAGTSSASPPAPPAPAPAPAAPLPPPPGSSDLLALDDLALGLSTAHLGTAGAGAQPAAGAAAPSGQPYDPFAASASVPILASSGPAAAPPPHPGAAPPPQSAFQTMFVQPGGQQAFAALASNAPPGPQQGPAQGPMYPPVPQPAPGAYPPPGPSYPPAAAPYPGGAYPSPYGQQAYGAPAPAYAAPPQYGAAPSGPPAQYGGAPYAAAAAAPAPTHDTRSADPFAMPPQSSNPFLEGSSAGMFLPGLPTGLPATSNPFGAAGHPPPPAAPAPAAPAPGTGISSSGPSVDHEWELFFADRAAGAAQPQK